MSTTLEKNPLLKLEACGQSIWLDDIHRALLVSGDLKRLIDEDGLTGVTSNPAIFEKAIAESQDYDDAINKMAVAGKSTEEIYRATVVKDIQEALDLFKGVYEKTNYVDGYVSLEVSPKLALDTEGTIKEAHELWEALDRPNAYIKVPGTQPCLPAIHQLLTDGISINVTLLFGLPRYQEIIETYISALEARAEKGLPLEKVSSVASFFLSRIDVLLDPQLEIKAKDLQGKVAIACAKVAYELYQKAFTSDRFQKLAAKGAKPQRLLWASTSVKNPVYVDTMYVDALIGPDTVDTIPMETLNAYRDHGNPASRISEGLDEAHAILDRLKAIGLSIDDVTKQLEEEGIEKFTKPFAHLIEAIESKRVAAQKTSV